MFSREKFKELAESARAATAKLQTQLQTQVQARRTTSSSDASGLQGTCRASLLPRSKPSTHLYCSNLCHFHCCRSISRCTGGSGTPLPRTGSSAATGSASSSSALSSLSPDETIHLLQSQVRAAVLPQCSSAIAALAAR